MKRKTDEKMAAILLRKQGYSVNEIVSELNVGKGSVSVWVRNIVLSEDAKLILEHKVSRGRLKAAEVRRSGPRNAYNKYFKLATEDFASLNIDKNSAKLLCALIYYCEGAKDDRGGVRFTNSNLGLMKVFIELLRKSFIISEDKLRVGLHLHDYHDPETQIAAWSKATNVDRSKFLRPYIKPHTGKRTREDYPGCAALYYHSNDTARQLLATAEAFMAIFSGV